MSGSYPRDLIGYGGSPPDPQWPGGASIAVQFVLNYEEGGERSVLDGDATSEIFLSEMVGAEAFPDRHMSMESLYEYGSRAGFWRVLRIFERAGVPLTVFAVATALARNPAAAAAITAAGHEVAGHGLRWLSYQDVGPEEEAAHLARAVRSSPTSWDRHRSVGTPDATLRTPAGSSWSTAGSSTTPTPTATTFRTGQESERLITSSCPTRWTPTTCGLHSPEVSLLVNNGSHTVATPLNCSGPKARRAAPRCYRSDCTPGSLADQDGPRHCRG